MVFTVQIVIKLNRSKVSNRGYTNRFDLFTDFCHKSKTR